MEETRWLEYISSILTAAKDVIDSFSVYINDVDNLYKIYDIEGNICPGPL